MHFNACRAWVIALLAVLGCTAEPPSAEVVEAERSLQEQAADVRAGRSDQIVVTRSAVTDADVAALGDLSGLRTLVLGETTLSNDGLRRIAEHRELDRLNLARVEADDEGLAAIATLPKLTSLRIGGPRLTDDGLKSLAGAKALRFLILRNAPITDAGLAHLVPLERLESLYLEGTKVTEAGERYLAEKRPDLHVHFP